MEKKEKSFQIVIYLLIILLGLLIFFSNKVSNENPFNWTINKAQSSRQPETQGFSDELNTLGENDGFLYCSNITSSKSPLPNIVLISIDGFSRQRFLQLQDNLTTIHNLLKEGWIQYNVTNFSNFTQTRNGHATMLSGYLGVKTGIMSNDLVYHPLPVGLTFLEKAEKELRETNIATAFITGKYKNIYPAFNTSALTQLDYVSIQEQGPSATGDKCIDFLDQYGETRFAALFHFRDPDKIGHILGEGSPLWFKSLKNVDEQINRILTKLDQIGVLENTLIYITTDHGFKFNGKNHLHESLTWLLSNDNDISVNIQQTRIGLQDIAPTIEYALNLPYDYSDPETGQPLQLDFTIDKITFREKYLIDDEKPNITIFDKQLTPEKYIIILNISGDANQLFLSTEMDHRPHTIISSTNIPLNMVSVRIEINREIVDEHSHLYIVAYDVAENYCSKPIHEIETP